MFHISKLPLCSSIQFSSLHPFLDHKHILPISAMLSSRPILIHVAVYTCAFSVKVVTNFFYLWHTNCSLVWTCLMGIPCEKGLSRLGYPARRKGAWEGTSLLPPALWGGETERGIWLCSLVPVAGWEWHKAAAGEGRMGIGIHFFARRMIKHWNRLPW